MVDIDQRIKMLADKCAENNLSMLMDKDDPLTDYGSLRSIKKQSNQYWLVFDKGELNVTCFFDLVAILKRSPIHS